MQVYNNDLDALQLAIKSEEDGYNFYTKISENSTNKIVKDTFVSFAGDELNHKKAINSFYRALSGGRVPHIFLSSKQEMTLKKAMSIFQNADRSYGDHTRPDSDIVEPYKIAAEFERNGIDFYKNLSSNSKNEKTKQLYNYLVKMEIGHKEILDNMITYLENSDIWFFENEKWLIEG